MTRSFERGDWGLMDAKERTKIAIHVTREILMKALDSPFTLTTMTMDLTKPEAVEDTVSEILAYLEKTKPKKPEEAEE